MRITIVQGAFFPVPPVMGGAVEKVWHALGREFARRGHEVTHISRRHHELPDGETLGGVRHVRISGFDAPQSLLHLKALDLLYSLRVLRHLPPAKILVTNTFWLPILPCPREAGKLYVHVQRYPRGQMRFYGQAARIQTVSSHIMRAIIAEAPRLEDRVSWIPNPLPGVEGAGDDAGAESPREKLILFVGRLHPEKGIQMLVEAVSQISDADFDGWKLAIIGPSEMAFGGGGQTYVDELMELSKRRPLRFEWVGPVFQQSELNRYYRRASLFVYPSLAEKGEASPLAPLEAMSQGCPALVSNLQCFQAYLRDEVTGFVFEHRDNHAAARLANRIRHIISDSPQLQRVGENARSKAREFTVERVADLYLNDFESLLE